MTIRFVCKSCGVELQAPEAHAGQPFNCPRCQRRQTVPRPAAPARSSAASAAGAAASAAATTQEPPSQPRSQIALFPVRAGRGKGGPGKRLSLRRPLHVELGPLGLMVYGHRLSPVRTAATAIVALVATLATGVVLAVFGPHESYWWALVTLVPWYLLAARVLHRLEDEEHKMSATGRAVFDDQDLWFSIEIAHELWFTFVPIQSQLVRVADEEAYEEIKARLGLMIGSRLQPRG